MEHTKENIIKLLMALDGIKTGLAEEANEKREYDLACEYYAEAVAYLRAVNIIQNKEYFDVLCKKLNLK